MIFLNPVPYLKHPLMILRHLYPRDADGVVRGDRTCVEEVECEEGQQDAQSHRDFRMLVHRLRAAEKPD